MNIYKNCWTAKKCAQIFGVEKCVTATGCVRIFETDGRLKIGLKISNSSEKEYDLKNTCFPLYTYGLASIEVCVKKISITNGKLRRFNLTVNICLGSRWVPWECFPVFPEKTISVTYFRADELLSDQDLDSDQNQPAVRTELSSFLIDTLIPVASMED